MLSVDADCHLLPSAKNGHGEPIPCNDTAQSGAKSARTKDAHLRVGTLRHDAQSQTSALRLLNTARANAQNAAKGLNLKHCCNESTDAQ